MVVVVVEAAYWKREKGAKGSGKARVIVKPGSIARTGGSTPLSIYRSDPQERDEAVAQEVAPKTAEKRGAHLGPSIEGWARTRAHEALTLHLPIAHPREQSERGVSVNAARCGEGGSELGADFTSCVAKRNNR